MDQQFGQRNEEYVKLKKNAEHKLIIQAMIQAAGDAGVKAVVHTQTKAWSKMATMAAEDSLRKERRTIENLVARTDENLANVEMRNNYILAVVNDLKAFIVRQTQVVDEQKEVNEQQKVLIDELRQEIEDSKQAAWQHGNCSKEESFLVWDRLQRRKDRDDSLILAVKVLLRKIKP